MEIVGEFGILPHSFTLSGSSYDCRGGTVKAFAKKIRPRRKAPEGPPRAKRQEVEIFLRNLRAERSGVKALTGPERHRSLWVICMNEPPTLGGERDPIRIRLLNKMKRLQYRTVLCFGGEDKNDRGEGKYLVEFWRGLRYSEKVRREETQANSVARPPYRKDAICFALCLDSRKSKESRAAAAHRWVRFCRWRFSGGGMDLRWTFFQGRS